VEWSSYSVLIYFMEESVMGDCVEDFREWRSLSWGTVSKALDKSRIPMSICFPLSNDCSMSCMVTTSCVSQE
jgi:hypothetical protein